MNAKTQIAKTLVIVSLVSATAAAIALPMHAAASKPAPQTALTLQHIRNGNYQIQNLACGYTQIQLKDGKGSNDGVDAILGETVFGEMTGQKGTVAVAHLAYHDDNFGWQQELVFLTVQHNKVLQSGEYPIDDRDTLKSFQFQGGQVVLETETRDQNNAPLTKVTKIALSSHDSAFSLNATEWQLDVASNKLVPYVDLGPYLSNVEEQISKEWSPTRKDRGERVEVSFKILSTGAISDLRINGSSEVPTADQAALEAVSKAAPFAPLPTGVSKPVDVCINFQAGISQHGPRS